MLLDAEQHRQDVNVVDSSSEKASQRQPNVIHSLPIVKELKFFNNW